MTGVGLTERITVTGDGNVVDRQSSIVQRLRHSQGFTLIELVVVVTLIVVLASIGLSTYTLSVRRAKEAVLREDLFRMKDAIDQFYADKGTYPPDLASLVTDGYMRQIPKDPITESSDTWQIVMPESDAANPNAAPGVYDIKSGAEGTAIDGTNYAEW